MTTRDRSANVRKGVHVREHRRSTDEVKRSKNPIQRGVRPQATHVRVQGGATRTPGFFESGRSSASSSSSSPISAATVAKPRVLTARAPLFGNVKPTGRIVVSVPVFKTPKDLLERAVGSLLEQTHPNVLIVVVSDGEKQPSYAGCSFTSDPRVITLKLQQNHGPYFIHDLVLRATAPGDLFAIQDSDDRSAPDRFEKLAAALLAHNADAAFPDVHVKSSRSTEIRRALDIRPAKAGALSHPADHFWLVRRESLLKLGGYYPGVRMGADSLYTSLMLRFGRTVAVPEAKYVRFVRSDSLSQKPSTGIGSPARKAAKKRLEHLWRRGRTVTETAKLISSQAETKSPVLAKLRGLIANSKKAQGSLATVLRHATFSEWAIKRRLAEALHDHVMRTRPKAVLELGSGASTLAMAHACKAVNAKLTSLEHDKAWLAKTRAALQKAGLLEHVLLVHAPLVGKPPMYARKALKRSYDFIFIDGPPEGKGGRAATLPALRGNLAPGWEVWLHDAIRPGERAAVAAWSKQLQFTTELSTTEDARGVYKLRATK